MLHKTYLLRTKTTDGLNENGNSLSDNMWYILYCTYNIWYCCTQTTQHCTYKHDLNRHYTEKKRKCHQHFSVDSHFCSEKRLYTANPNIYIFFPIFRALRTVILLCLVQYFLSWHASYFHTNCILIAMQCGCKSGTEICQNKTKWFRLMAAWQN